MAAGQPNAVRRKRRRALHRRRPPILRSGRAVRLDAVVRRATPEGSGWPCVFPLAASSNATAAHREDSPYAASTSPCLRTCSTDAWLFRSGLQRVLRLASGRDIARPPGTQLDMHWSRAGLPYPTDAGVELGSAVPQRPRTPRPTCAYVVPVTSGARSERVKSHRSRRLSDRSSCTGARPSHGTSRLSCTWAAHLSGALLQANPDALTVSWATGTVRRYCAGRVRYAYRQCRITRAHLASSVRALLRAGLMRWLGRRSDYLTGSPIRPALASR